FTLPAPTVLSTLSLHDALPISLLEREVLLRAAPHIIRPLRLILPHHSGLRPRWFLRLGLFVYDRLGGGRTLPRTRSIDLRRDAADRKSTRLNSSHLVISYAVFC